MNNKTKRFLFNNIGGLLALAAVFMEAGTLKEKINTIASTSIKTEVHAGQIDQRVQEVSIDVAVIKSRLTAIENGQKNGHAK